MKKNQVTNQRPGAFKSFLIVALMILLPFSGIISGGFGASVLAQTGSRKPISTNGNPQNGGSRPPSGNQPDTKISRDLRVSINNDASKMMRVIVQTQTPPQKTKDFLTALSRTGGTIRKSFTRINAAVVEIPAASVDSLLSRTDIKFISPDRPTQVSGHVEVTTGTSLARSYGTPTTGVIDGHGIGIAVLDSGIYSAHDSLHSSTLQSRVVANVDFTGEGRTDDPYGHGAHVATLAAGNNEISGGAYTGTAPAANLINVRVLDSQGRGTSSALLSGIDWCIQNKNTYNIRVMNLSLGTVAVDSYVNDPICLAVRQAVEAGIVVCVAAGNLGKDENGNKIFGAIHSPGIEPSVITVGAANTKGTDSRSDDTVATYSSCGPTRGYYTDSYGEKHYDNLIKPDLIAPGNKLISAKSPNNYLVTTHPELDALVSPLSTRSMMTMSGTSMATPVVSGVVALMLQRNPALTPNMVKAILEYTAQPLAGFSTIEQGAGLLNVEGSVRLAGLVRPDFAGLPAGSPLLTGTAPTEATTIANETFVWGGGIIQKWNFLTGSNLITQCQGIYGTGVILSDGVILSNGSFVPDGVLLSQGVILSNGVILSDGTTLGSGPLLADSVLLADGTMFADGVMLSDGVLIADSILSDTTAAQSALSTPYNGDDGPSLVPVPDGNH